MKEKSLDEEHLRLSVHIRDNDLVKQKGLPTEYDIDSRGSGVNFGYCASE